MHGGCAATTPGAAAGSENTGSILHELFLLSRGELDHAMLVVRVGEGREDPALQTEIGMVHVGGLDGAGDAQGERAEFGGGHIYGIYRRTRRERSPENCKEPTTNAHEFSTGGTRENGGAEGQESKISTEENERNEAEEGKEPAAHEYPFTGEDRGRGRGGGRGR